MTNNYSNAFSTHKHRVYIWYSVSTSRKPPYGSGLFTLRHEKVAGVGEESR